MRERDPSYSRRKGLEFVPSGQGRKAWACPDLEVEGRHGQCPFWGGRPRSGRNQAILKQHERQKDVDLISLWSWKGGVGLCHLRLDRGRT